MIRLFKIATLVLILQGHLFAHGQEIIIPITFAVFAVPVLLWLLIFILNGHRKTRWRKSRLSPKQLALRAKMVKAWSAAVSDLGIKFRANFRFEDTDYKYVFWGHIKDFGSPQGTLLGFIGEQGDDFGAIALRVKQKGFFYSELSDGYGTYFRTLFQDMLNDLGYFGPERDKPEWYTGEINL